MSLHFNINYNTVFGQELILNVIGGVDDGEERISQYHMSSYDGKTWQYTMRKGVTPGGRFDYFYSVNRGDVCERTEWRMISHRLEISERNAENYICFDNWIDIPDDSYLYTSAFKDCVSPSNVVPVKEETLQPHNTSEGPCPTAEERPEPRCCRQGRRIRQLGSRSLHRARSAQRQRMDCRLGC